MINKNQECDIISDLLPLYVEGRTGKESNEFVEGHLEHCLECQRNLQYMKATDYEVKECEGGGAVVDGKLTHKKINGFKKIRGRMFVCGYLLVLLCVWMYMFWILLG